MKQHKVFIDERIKDVICGGTMTAEEKEAWRKDNQPTAPRAPAQRAEAPAEFTARQVGEDDAEGKAEKKKK